jgi:hypothetical protein
VEGLRAGSLAVCIMSDGIAHAVIGVAVSRNIPYAHGNGTDILELSNRGVCVFRQSSENGVYSRDTTPPESISAQGWVMMWKPLKQRTG